MPDTGLTPPSITLARAIQGELQGRRAANVQLARLGMGVRFSIEELYTAVCARFVSQGVTLHKQAIRWEEELSIIRPGWEPSEGQGPVADWEAAWLKPGYLKFGTSGYLQSAFPARARDTPVHCTRLLRLDGYAPPCAFRLTLMGSWEYAPASQ